MQTTVIFLRAAFALQVTTRLLLAPTEHVKVAHEAHSATSQEQDMQMQAVATALSEDFRTKNTCG